eukprot:scaffold90277_cov45-Phaeocystis_antarctica.AAC.1
MLRRFRARMLSCCDEPKLLQYVTQPQAGTARGHTSQQKTRRMFADWPEISGQHMTQLHFGVLSSPALGTSAGAHAHRHEA